MLAVLGGAMLGSGVAGFLTGEWKGAIRRSRIYLCIVT